MKICAKCILPDTFPGAKFDEKGVCSHCLSFKGVEVLQEQKREYEEKFISLIKEHKGKGTYDCLMAYSGGKDSTYTLDILKNRYGLSILAVTFDNGFISPVAMENMRKVVENIGADHIIFKVRFDLLKKIFSAAAKTELYPKKTLERASTICTSCISFVKFLTLKMAIEKRIPFIGYGWSPGQAPIQSSIMRTNPSLIKMTQKVIYDPLYKIAGDDIKPYFLEERHFVDKEAFPYNIHPLAFLEYSEAKIFARMKEIGWQKPEDTDANSTNCLLNAFANQLHEKTYGYNPYVWEIANMVREGVMTRDEGMEKIYKDGGGIAGNKKAEMIEMVKERLEI